MAFTKIEYPRGRKPLLDKVTVAYSVVSSRPALVVRIGTKVAEGLGWKVGDHIEFAWGAGADKGKVRMNKGKPGEGNRLTIRGNGTSPTVWTTSLPPEFKFKPKKAAKAEYKASQGSMVVDLP